jgi:hypothetical protein
VVGQRQSHQRVDAAGEAVAIGEHGGRGRIRSLCPPVPLDLHQEGREDDYRRRARGREEASAKTMEVWMGGRTTRLGALVASDGVEETTEARGGWSSGA